MIRRMIFAAVLFCVPFSHAFAQTVDAKQFPGADVATKVANAQQTLANGGGCANDIAVTGSCVILIDPILAKSAPGTMGTPCSNCIWIDQRNVGGFGLQIWGPGANGSPIGFTRNGGICLGGDTNITRIGTGIVGIGGDCVNLPFTGILKVGIINFYNNNNLVLNGIPSTIFQSNSSTQTASIGATTMVASVPGTTLYRVNFYAVQTQSGIACTGNTTIVATVTFTDPNAAGSFPINVGTFTITTNGVVNTPIPVTVGSSVYELAAKNATAIQFSTTYSLGAGCTTSPGYQLRAILEQQ